MTARLNIGSAYTNERDIGCAMTTRHYIYPSTWIHSYLPPNVQLMIRWSVYASTSGVPHTTGGSTI